MIYSIGAGNEGVQDLIQRLNKWKIQCIVDLRSEPYSQYVPQFNRDRLTNILNSEKIDYLYFGDKLGGRPLGGFQQYRSSPKFKESVDLLLKRLEGKTAALMCSEFDISKCHRRFIVEEIVKKGFDVTVIDKEGNCAKFIIENSKKTKRLKEKGDSKNQVKLTAFGEKENE